MSHCKQNGLATQATWYRTTPESQSSYSTGSRAGLVDPAVLAQSKMEHEGLELPIATQQGDANTASCCTTWLKPFSGTMGN